MDIQILIDGSHVPIDRAVFVALLDNSVANSRAAFGHALETSKIKFHDLVALARVGDIPYSLFFAPLPVVETQIHAKSEKLLGGITKKTFSLNSRRTVELRDIERIVKDLLRKQEYLKAKDPSLVKNPIVGSLRRPGNSVEEDADKLLGLLGITFEDLRARKTKAAVVELLIRHLEANQVMVAQSQNNFMPQQLKGVKFSGMTIKDLKVPYIFLAGGDEGDHLEPAGRRVFTLTLMCVLIACGVFAPVTYDGHSAGADVGREYEIVGQILMPAAEFRLADLGTLDAVKEIADLFKVTPSAVIVRALRLGILGQASAGAYLDELALEFRSRKAPPMRQPSAYNALRKYNGREFSRRMLHALDDGQLTAGEFCRVVCQNRIKPTQISDFRAAVV